MSEHEHDPMAEEMTRHFKMDGGAGAQSYEDGTEAAARNSVLADKTPDERRQDPRGAEIGGLEYKYLRTGGQDQANEAHAPAGHEDPAPRLAGLDADQARADVVAASSSYQGEHEQAARGGLDTMQLERPAVAEPDRMATIADGVPPEKLQQPLGETLPTGQVSAAPDQAPTTLNQTPTAPTHHAKPGFSFMGRVRSVLKGRGRHT